MPPQLVRPSGQTIALQVVGPGPTVQQPPIWQEGESGGQVTKHAPQLVGSPVVSTQASPQHVCPGPQPVVRQLVPPMHTEPTHTCPAAQASPQPPQFVADDATLVSQPFEAFPSQSAKPPSQRATPQLALVQPAVAWSKGPQLIRQPPQLFTSPWVSAQKASQQVSVPVQPPRASHGRRQVKSRQLSPGAQSPAERHSTQEFASTRQRGVGELQSVSSLQPGTQVCVRPSQSSPMGQLSGEVLHSTQRPLATSQTGVAGVGAQSTLLVQAELPSGGGTKPSRMLPSSGPAST